MSEFNREGHVELFALIGATGLKSNIPETGTALASQLAAAATSEAHGIVPGGVE
jgi:hypothetical protein